MLAPANLTAPAPGILDDHLVIGKVRFTLLNYHKSSSLTLQLQNRITKTIQLLKPGKFGPLGGFEGGLSFYENLNIQFEIKINFK